MNSSSDYSEVPSKEFTFTSEEVCESLVARQCREEVFHEVPPLLTFFCL